MNNKGFTLIELLVTIMLLSVISVISFVSVNSAIVKSKKKNCESVVTNIKSATMEYVSDHRYDNTFSTGTNNINAKVLVDNKYLSAPIYDPFTKNEVNPSDIVINFVLDSNYIARGINIASSVFSNCESA